MERYFTRRCYLGTNLHFAAISTSSALRTRLFFKGEGMLVLKSDQLLVSFFGKILGREPRLISSGMVRTIQVWSWDHTGAPTLNMV